MAPFPDPDTCTKYVENYVLPSLNSQTGLSKGRTPRRGRPSVSEATWTVFAGHRRAGNLPLGSSSESMLQWESYPSVVTCLLDPQEIDRL
jgi:hypothetical protein